MTYNPDLKPNPNCMACDGTGEINIEADMDGCSASYECKCRPEDDRDAKKPKAKVVKKKWFQPSFD